MHTIMIFSQIIIIFSHQLSMICIAIYYNVNVISAIVKSHELIRTINGTLLRPIFYNASRLHRYHLSIVATSSVK